MPWVTDASGKAPNDYAGIYGHVIDGIQVKLVNKPGYHAEVRVQLTDRTGWLSWSSQYSTGADAYAGIYGIGIDRVQIRSGEELKKSLRGVRLPEGKYCIIFVLHFVLHSFNLAYK